MIAAIASNGGYVSAAFLASGAFLLLVTSRGLREGGDSKGSSIAVGVGWTYVAIGVIAVIATMMPA